MFKFIKRAVLSLRIYADDIEIDGQTETLQFNISPELRRKIEHKRIATRRHRALLRSRLDALLPIGQRRIWLY